MLSAYNFTGLPSLALQNIEKLLDDPLPFPSELSVCLPNIYIYIYIYIYMYIIAWSYLSVAYTILFL